MVSDTKVTETDQATDVGSSANMVNINDSRTLENRLVKIEEEIHGQEDRDYKGLKERVTDLEKGILSTIGKFTKWIGGGVIALILWE